MPLIDDVISAIILAAMPGPRRARGWSHSPRSRGRGGQTRAAKRHPCILLGRGHKAESDRASLPGTPQDGNPGATPSAYTSWQHDRAARALRLRYQAERVACVRKVSETATTPPWLRDCHLAHTPPGSSRRAHPCARAERRIAHGAVAHTKTSLPAAACRACAGSRCASAPAAGSPD